MKKAILSLNKFKTDAQDVIETRAFQVRFDKHLYSVKKLAELNEIKVEPTLSDADETLQQTIETEYLKNNRLVENLTRKSWLFNYKIVILSYPSYKSDLQEYLRRRTKVTTDNNGHTFTIRADRLWEDYELMDENLEFTCCSILELLEINVAHYRFHGVKEGRIISIFMLK